jgi:predicted ATPase
MKVDRINIAGFRRLRAIDVPLKPFMALVGANGVGKTSFLDAFSLLSASASGRLNETLSRLGGIADIQTRGKGEGLSFTLGVQVAANENPLVYSLRLATKGAGYSIVGETLTQQRPGHDRPFVYIDSSGDNVCYFDVEQGELAHRPNWDHNPLETSLAQVPRMFREPEDVRRILSTATQYHALDVGPRAPVKLPQQMKPATLPGVDGEDLIPCLYYLRESNRDRFEAVTDSLRAAFPDFEELNFPPVAAGMLSMTWKDRNFNKPVYMHELSEGMLRFLWLISLLQSPNLATVTMIDEPEVSMHPELLRLLADLMREASRRTQLIVATHSDRLVRFLKPEEVLVMDTDDDGGATLAWADTLDLEKWLAEYSLDEVWRMGRMGGR